MNALDDAPVAAFLWTAELIPFLACAASIPSSEYRFSFSLLVAILLEGGDLSITGQQLARQLNLDTEDAVVALLIGVMIFCLLYDPDHRISCLGAGLVWEVGAAVISGAVSDERTVLRTRRGSDGRATARTCPRWRIVSPISARTDTLHSERAALDSHRRDGCDLLRLA